MDRVFPHQKIYECFFFPEVNKLCGLTQVSEVDLGRPFKYMEIRKSEQIQ